MAVTGQARIPRRGRQQPGSPREAGQGRLLGAASPGGSGSEEVLRILRTANSIQFDTFTESLSGTKFSVRG